MINKLLLFLSWDSNIIGPFKTKSPKPALSLSCCALFLLKRRRLRLLQPRLYVPRLSEALHQLLTPKFKHILLCVSVRIHGNTTAQSRRTPNPTRPTRTQYHRNQTHSGPALSVSLSLTFIKLSLSFVSLNWMFSLTGSKTRSSATQRKQAISGCRRWFVRQ